MKTFLHTGCIAALLLAPLGKAEATLTIENDSHGTVRVEALRCHLSGGNLSLSGCLHQLSGSSLSAALTVQISVLSASGQVLFRTRIAPLLRHFPPYLKALDAYAPFSSSFRAPPDCTLVVKVDQGC